MTEDDSKRTPDQPIDSDHEPDTARENDAPAGDAPVNGPSSAAPPRVVSEAPLGGVARPLVPPTPPAADPDSDDSPAGDAPSKDEAIDVLASETFGVEEIVSSVPDLGDTLPGNLRSREKLQQRSADAPDPTPSAHPPIEPPSPTESTTPGDKEVARQVRERLAQERAAQAPGDDAGAGEVEARERPQVARDEGEVAPDSPAPARPAPGATPAADASEWDEDISPELAAVLFGGKSDSAPAPAAEPAPAEPSAPAAEPDTAAEAAPAPPAPAPEPDAAPIELIDTAQARTLAITADKRSAPAPEIPLEGRVRYVRIEEPLKGDEGQRTQETWEYLKPDYPGLDGRLVREVTIEEIQYADGSWSWRYERRYNDRGRDAREVRANADRTYIEREDEVSKLDPDSGKRLQFKEEANLIYAPEKQPEEKRGLLGTLGDLFDRDDDDEQAGPRVWRAATSAEERHMRKHGGSAFKRGGFLGL